MVFLGLPLNDSFCFSSGVTINRFLRYGIIDVFLYAVQK